MRFASYARKSVYSDRSDSIKNQLEMNREFVDFKYPGQVDSFVCFSDEGVSGATSDRPGLKELLADVRAGLFDCLVVYQLDRLSRDLRDFANIYALLEERRVKFISISENIDTSTPIGKAMMYVTAVFAQMERENIANRVSDNMQGLARRGFWTGGNPPVGYVRSSVVVGGKKHCTIAVDPEGATYVRWIFDEFLRLGKSLQGMETYFKNNGIRTRSGKFFSTTQLHKILTMPFCVPACPEVWDFYSAKGCQMEGSRESWDGSTGVMIYGRSTERNKKHELQPPEKWIVSKGIHEPFIPSELWLAVQQRFSNNRFDKTMKYDIPLLKGALRCSCGSIMCASRKKKVDGSVSTWYYCLKRMRQGTEACDRRQIKAEVLDREVLKVFASIRRDPEVVKRYVAAQEPSGDVVDLSAKKSQVAAQEAKIGRLAASLAMASDSAASKYIIAEMERLDLDLAAMRVELQRLEAQARRAGLARKSQEERFQEIWDKISDFENFDHERRNAIVRAVVQELTWDGTTLFIKL